MIYRIARDVTRISQRNYKSGGTKTVALPPVWASMFVIPAVALFALLPDHGGVAFFTIAPVVLGLFLLGGFIVFQIVRNTPKPRPPQMYARTQAKPMVTTFNTPRDYPGRSEYLAGLEKRNEEAEHTVQAMALFQVDCPEPRCKAVTGQPCKLIRFIPVARVDSGHSWYCHITRMKAAVESGDVDREQLVAQFDGHLPEGLSL